MDEKQERSGQAEQSEAREQAKKPYQPPQLVRHGTVEELTRGTTAVGPQTDAFSLVVP